MKARFIREPKGIEQIFTKTMFDIALQRLRHNQYSKNDDLKKVIGG